MGHLHDITSISEDIAQNNAEIIKLESEMVKSGTIKRIKAAISKNATEFNEELMNLESNLEKKDTIIEMLKSNIDKLKLIPQDSHHSNAVIAKYTDPDFSEWSEVFMSVRKVLF